MGRYQKNNGPDPLDRTPLEIPAGAIRPPTLEEQIAKFLHMERQRESDMEFESFEEANDFDADDDDLLDFSRYELREIQEEYIEPLPKQAQEGPKQAASEEKGSQVDPTPGPESETPSGASD